MAGVVGVAIMDRNGNRVYRKAPSTYLKIKWINIAEEDCHLCPDGYIWIPRADLTAMLGREHSDRIIREVWGKQDTKHMQWLEGGGRESPDRSPTPFHLTIHG